MQRGTQKPEGQGPGEKRAQRSRVRLSSRRGAPCRVSPPTAILGTPSYVWDLRLRGRAPRGVWHLTRGAQFPGKWQLSHRASDQPSNVPLTTDPTQGLLRTRACPVSSSEPHADRDSASAGSVTPFPRWRCEGTGQLSGGRAATQPSIPPGAHGPLAPPGDNLHPHQRRAGVTCLSNEHLERDAMPLSLSLMCPRVCPQSPPPKSGFLSSHP